jgi:S-DNA-T family DNA segregation ATPase FtsK/SpoIIIE
MLFLQPGTDQLIRAQGAMVEDSEIKQIIDYMRKQTQADFNPELSRLSYTDADGQAIRDPLFDKAVEMVLASDRASVSLLQRRLGIPFARAGRIIEMMAESGIVSADRGSRAREILIAASEWKAIQKQTARDAAAGFADLQDDDEGVPATIDDQNIRD